MYWKGHAPLLLESNYRGVDWVTGNFDPENWSGIEPHKAPVGQM